MPGKQNTNPKRYRAARGDSSLQSLKEDMAAVYGIPPESIRFINPDGRTARRNKRVAKLREDYRRKN